MTVCSEGMKMRKAEKAKSDDNIFEKLKCHICLFCGKTYKDDYVKEQPTFGIGFICECGSDWFATYYNTFNKIPEIGH